VRSPWNLESFLKGKEKGNAHKDNVCMYDVGSKVQRNVRVRNKYTLVCSLAFEAKTTVSRPGRVINTPSLRVP
jgi:hypothetical protein